MDNEIFEVLLLALVVHATAMHVLFTLGWRIPRLAKTTRGLLSLLVSDIVACASGLVLLSLHTSELGERIPLVSVLVTLGWINLGLHIAYGTVWKYFVEEARGNFLVRDNPPAWRTTKSVAIMLDTIIHAAIFVAVVVALSPLVLALGVGLGLGVFWQTSTRYPKADFQLDRESLPRVERYLPGTSAVFPVEGYRWRFPEPGLFRAPEASSSGASVDLQSIARDHHRPGAPRLEQ